MVNIANAAADVNLRVMTTVLRVSGNAGMRCQHLQ
jgi:hypothetical protein